MAMIGIDLGTTNSLGAVYRDGKVELIPNRFGSYLTPSVVSMESDGSIVVGEIAKARMVTAPERTVSSFKKDMGTERKWLLGEKVFLPEELSSFVIRSIVEDAENYLGEKVEEAVISVPAYFHDSQRVATKRAGALADVRVNRIINEPSAAALASYFDTGHEQLFLIFDFGGGTLDVSIVECFDTMVEILSVSGDNRLGGDSFHEIMVENFLKEHDLSRKQISNKEYAILLRQAESCKQRLTTEEIAAMTAVLGGVEYKSEYTNDRLLEESGIIFAKIKDVLMRALRDGDLRVQDMDTVVMVGGSSKMPLVQSYLQHLFGMIPVVTENCDEMIARGLGLVCAVKARKEEVKDFVLTDICPFTLGTDIVNEADPEHLYMEPIVERNTVLPCSRVERFYTSHNNQTKIEIQILQGEHAYADDNLKLGKMSVSVPRKKAGEEAVDIRFTYDINGILIVDITVVSTGKTITKVISQKIEGQELERKAAELEKLKIHPKELSENKLIMEKLQALYEEVPTYLREQIRDAIQQFEYYLAKQNPRSIRNYRTYLEQMIEMLEGYDPFAAVMEFDGYQDEEWEDEEDEGGGQIWTS
ncbi:MAG: Hsp70 family protein [Lachnospiraceae bacterium]|nr:Hsp70 family protein [Lachnospiraceae bacterium]